MKLTLAAVPFLVIPYDSLTHLLGLDPGETSQTLPVTAVFSLVYLVLRAGRLRFSPTSAKVFRYLVLAAACIAAVTVTNMVAESFGIVGGDNGMRLPTALRQGVSLTMGYLSFLMFQDALVRIGWQTAFRWVLIGGLPSLLLCFVQILLGSPRVQGFSSEPSHLGDMLVLAFLPACACASLGWSWRGRGPLMVSGVAALLAAFSGTGIMKAAFAVLSLSVVKGKVMRGLAGVTVALTAFYGLLLLYPDNYLFHLFALFEVFLDSGTLVGGSFIDRFFGFAAPVGMLSEVHGWLGFGLGGDTVYFDQIFDEDTAAAIRLEKTTIASISSLQAKMLLYSGVLGYGCYLAAWWTAWRAAPQAHPARYMLPTVFAASLFSLGPFFLPYVWLWLAFGATAAPAARRVAVRRKRRIVLRDPSAAAAPALRDALTP